MNKDVILWKDSLRLAIGDITKEEFAQNYNMSLNEVEEHKQFVLDRLKESKLTESGIKKSLQ